VKPLRRFLFGLEFLFRAVDPAPKTAFLQKLQVLTGFKCRIAPESSAGCHRFLVPGATGKCKSPHEKEIRGKAGAKSGLIGDRPIPNSKIRSMEI
jgi:hypothetical protein